MSLKVISAPEGKIYTDSEDFWARKIYLSALDSEDNYKLVPEEEYTSYREAIEKMNGTLEEENPLNAIDSALNELT